MTSLPCASGLWLPPADGETHGKGNPPENVIRMMEEHGQHGIVISGMISWIEVHRHSAAGTIWRQVAETAWNFDEVTEAKQQLLSILNPLLLKSIEGSDKEFKAKRITIDKVLRKSREMFDIICILDYLTSRNIMPLVLATSCQMRKSPKSLGSLSPEASLGEMATKVQSLEACMENYMTFTKQQIENLTEIVSEKRSTSQSRGLISLSETPQKKRKIADDTFGSPQGSYATPGTPHDGVSDMEVVISQEQNT